VAGAGSRSVVRHRVPPLRSVAAPGVSPAWAVRSLLWRPRCLSLLPLSLPFFSLSSGGGYCSAKAVSHVKLR
jgi:hypothetical protein